VPAVSGQPESVTRAIRQLQQGTRPEESFRVLYETYHSSVRGFFARRLSSTDECLDLTQETFLRVYKGMKAYRGDAPFGAWLFRIAWNVLHSHRAKAAKRKDPTPLEETNLERTLTTDDTAHQSPGADAFSSVLRGERRRILRDAVAALPPQRRRCIILWAYQQLSYEQIAVVMRLSIGTVKAHLAQARGQLETLVAGATDESGGGS
jgi:RNA polymerase sigma-70 factor (ECF subfamily)